MGIGDTFSLIFGNIRYQYFCRQGALVMSANNIITVTERVQEDCSLASKVDTTAVLTH